LSGQNNDHGFCGLFGQTIPFSAQTLASLYPTHDVYVDKFERATDRAQDRGFLLPVDTREIETIARTAPIPH
jgi:Alpha/beta hydrolase domain